MALGHRVLAALVVAALFSCTAQEGARTPGDGGAASSLSANSAAPTTSPEPAPPLTERQRIRRVLRDRSPDVGEVIALAKTPSAWVRGADTVLVEYSLMTASYWPDDATVSAGRVVDRRGRVLGEWADNDPTHRTYWPAGRDFVGMPQYGGRPWLVRDGAISRLGREPGTRPVEAGDVRFGRGWLLDPSAGTVTREQLPGCRQDSIRTDLQGRVWCLDAQKTRLSWSDDGGETWEGHTLSTSYLEFCDGGARGVDLEVQGEVVAIGMWRADFSLDRGRTWRDVGLPLGLVGSHRANAYTEANCTTVQPLPDGRLVLEYFGAAVGADATNTRFAAIRTPPRSTYAGVQEGVLVAVSRRPYGERWASYDGAGSWRPLRAGPLVRHLLSERAQE